MFSKYNTPSWQLMHQQCLLQQMFPIWREGEKKWVSNNNLLHSNMCMVLYSLQSTFNVYIPSTNPWNHHGRQTGHMLYCLPTICPCPLLSCCFMSLWLTRALPESWNSLLPLLCLSFHLANSQPTLKIDTIAAFFKSSGILHSDWDVSLLYFFYTMCSVAMITLDWNHLLVFLSLSLGCALIRLHGPHLIALTPSLSRNKDLVTMSIERMDA